MFREGRGAIPGQSTGGGLTDIPVDGVRELLVGTPLEEIMVVVVKGDVVAGLEDVVIWPLKDVVVVIGLGAAVVVIGRGDVTVVVVIRRVVDVVVVGCAVVGCVVDVLVVVLDT